MPRKVRKKKIPNVYGTQGKSHTGSIDVRVEVREREGGGCGRQKKSRDDEVEKKM